MIRPLKIAHTSDVHLHDGADAAPIRAAFAQVVDAVLETDAELFLIAGEAAFCIGVYLVIPLITAANLVAYRKVFPKIGAPQY